MICVRKRLFVMLFSKSRPSIRRTSIILVEKSIWVRRKMLRSHPELHRKYPASVCGTKNMNSNIHWVDKINYWTCEDVKVQIEIFFLFNLVIYRYVWSWIQLSSPVVYKYPDIPISTLLNSLLLHFFTFSCKFTVLLLVNVAW